MKSRQKRPALTLRLTLMACVIFCASLPHKAYALEGYKKNYLKGIELKDRGEFEEAVKHFDLAPDDRDVIKFQVSTLPGHRKDTEYIKVICTREPLDILQEIRPSGTFSVMDNTTFALTKVARVLSSIPLKYRAEDTAIYQIINPAK